MKIFFLTRRAWPEIGGVEKHVLEVSKELVKRGHEVTVICEDGGGFSRPPLAETPTDVGGKKWSLIRIPVGRNEKLKKFRIWGWIWEHRELIREADIVHAHDVGFWYWPFRFLYPRKPFFMTFHGWEEKFPVPLSNKIQRKISEKMAKGNLCVGDYLTKWYGTRADYVICGGVNVPPRRSHGFTDVQPATVRGEAMELIFIGRLDEQTGIMTYLEAFRKMLKQVQHDKQENWRLLILGDGPLRNKIEQYIKENKLNALVLGFVDDPEKYLQKARFVFTSGYLSILEAMAERKLVFSVFDNPLKEDYLKMTPFKKFIIICKTPEELAEKLKYYSKNQKETDKLTEKAYNWVQKQTWGKITKTYLELWKQRILDKPE